MNKPLQKASGNFSETEIEGEVVVMSLADGEFFSLTDTAAKAWGLIDGTRDRDALVAALAAVYGTDSAAISADVDSFLAELSRAGILAV